MKLNTRARHAIKTHEGAPAFPHLSPIQQLQRSVLSCLLWEREFYEDGKAIADRISETVAQCRASDVAALAVEARSSFNLRHVPLLLLDAMARCRVPGYGADLRSFSDVVAQVIQRPDDMTELLAIYWRDGRKKLPNGFRRGLAKAFNKFDSYQISKYASRDGAVKLRDVLFLAHPDPDNAEQATTWKALADKTLEPAETWEVALSGGADKRETFEQLLRDGKLGYLALLRNLRGMAAAGVDLGLIRDAILARKGARRVLPFRYVAAARACPQMEPAIDQALHAAIADLPEIPGRTIVLVDVSGSMDAPLSSKSDMRRIDAAAALASVMRCADLRVFTFSWCAVEVPPRRGMAGIDAVIQSQPHGGTCLGDAMRSVNAVSHDRIIVITDEQSQDAVPAPVARHAYMINVASARNGVGYGRWTHIDGFSEQVIRFIVAHEAAAAGDPA